MTLSSITFTKQTFESVLKALKLGETELRLAKVGQFWSQIGFRKYGTSGFQNCERWLGKVTVCQNVLRLVKATEMFYNVTKEPLSRKFQRQMSTLPNTSPNNSPAPDRKKPSEETLEKSSSGREVSKQSKEDVVIGLVSAATLAVVSTASIINFLGKEKILVFSNRFKANIGTFCTYGGGLWGNLVAALGSYRTAWVECAKMNKVDIESQISKEKKILKKKEAQEKIDNSTMSFGKYSLDLFAAVMDLKGVNLKVILAVKGVSNHLAITQSFRSVGPIPGWEGVNWLMGFKLRDDEASV